MQKKWLLFDVATVLISMFCLFPAVTKSNSFRLLVVASCIYVLIVSFKKVVIANRIPILKIVIVFIISFFISYIIGIKDSVNFYIYFTITIIFILIFEQYRMQRLKSMKLTVFVVLLLLFIANCQTIIQLFLNPSYARLLTKNQDVVEVVGFSGGYGLVYASLLTFIAIALPVVKQKKISKLFHILLLLATSSSVFLIWKAGFFLALVLLGVGILIMIIGVEKHQIMRSITISIFVLGTLFIFRNSISNTIISSTLDTKYEEKVSDIFQDNSIDSDEFGERQNRYSRDLNLMLEYPVIGCWQFLLVGKHSFILDILAQYGLIFGGFFLFAMFFIPIQLLKKSEGIAFNQSVVFVLVLFIFLLLNTLSISILPIIFIIFPYANHLLQQK